MSAGTSPAFGPELSHSFTLRRRRVVLPGRGSCSAMRPGWIAG